MHDRPRLHSDFPASVRYDFEKTATLISILENESLHRSSDHPELQFASTAYCSLARRRPLLFTEFELRVVVVEGHAFVINSCTAWKTNATTEVNCRCRSVLLQRFQSEPHTQMTVHVLAFISKLQFCWNMT